MRQYKEDFVKNNLRLVKLRAGGGMKSKNVLKTFIIPNAIDETIYGIGYLRGVQRYVTFRIYDDATDLPFTNTNELKFIVTTRLCENVQDELYNENTEDMYGDSLTEPEYHIM